MIVALNRFYSNENLRKTIDSSFEKIDAFFEFQEGLFDYDLNCKEISIGNCDFFIFPLHLIPIERKSDFKIWALLKRNEPGNVLLIQKEFLDRSKRIPIPENALVIKQENVLSESICELRRDLSFQNVQIDNLICDLDAGAIQFAIIEQMFLNKNMVENYEQINLGTREFGHGLGQGSLAIIGKSEDDRGKIFRQVHDLPTAVVCNIERKFGSLAGGLVNAHSEIDNAGNHHLWAFVKNGEKIKKTHISQSTRNEIEERAIEQLF